MTGSTASQSSDNVGLNSRVGETSPVLLIDAGKANKLPVSVREAHARNTGWLAPWLPCHTRRPSLTSCSLCGLVVVGAAGLEPATLGLEIRCSIRLSYAPKCSSGTLTGLWLSSVSHRPLETISCSWRDQNRARRNRGVAPAPWLFRNCWTQLPTCCTVTLSP